MKRTAIATAGMLGFTLFGSVLTAPIADAAPRVDYTLRVCASDKTPTRATITYGVGIGESIAEQGTTDRWLGEGCWERTVPATTIDGASVRAIADKPGAYIGCAVWAHGKRLKKDYAYGKCDAYARIG